MRAASRPSGGPVAGRRCSRASRGSSVAAEREGEHALRVGIEPLQVVDRDDELVAGRERAQRGEQRNGDQVPPGVGRLGLGPASTQRDLQRGLELRRAAGRSGRSR